MFSPIPLRLVQRNQALQYVDMKELLPDNIGLLRHLQAPDSPNALVPLASSSRPRLREVNSLLSWTLCFTTYIAVLVESHPGVVRSRWAYFALIVAEARRNGGDGWQSYNAIFRQNATEDEGVDWTRLDTSLHGATFVAQSSGTGSVCLYCSASDHSPRDCTLRPPGGSWSSSSRSQGGAQHSTHRERESPRLRPMPASVPVCIHWNNGDCYSATCRYRHSCATCPGSHQAYLCPSALPGSFYKCGAPKAQEHSASSRS